MDTGRFHRTRPDDVPDLPIRARLALLTWPLAMLLLTSVLFLALIRLSTTGDSLPLIGLIALGYAALAALWLADRRRRVARARNAEWWHVTSNEGHGRLALHWTPRDMADLMPRTPPAFLIGLLPTAAAASQFQRLLQPGWPASATAFLVFFVFIGLPALMALKFALYARARPDEQAMVEFGPDGVRLETPFVRRVWRLTIWPRTWLRWSSIRLPASRVASVAFEPGGAIITSRRRFLRHESIRVPATAPEQRRAIADWAGEHGIAVTGIADPRS